MRPDLVDHRIWIGRIFKGKKSTADQYKRKNRVVEVLGGNDFVDKDTYPKRKSELCII